MTDNAAYLAIVVLVLATLPSCRTSTVVDEYRPNLNLTPATASEAIVVLGRRHEMDKETERDFIRCVGEELAGGAVRHPVIAEETFVDAMYPWFEASTAPMDVTNLDELLQIEAVAAKFDEFGIRYFIWIDGFTETVGSLGSIMCSVGIGGGGCFGFKSWDDAADYEASIWDLKDATLSGKVNTHTTGTSYMPALIVPIPLLARVKATACDALADQLRTFIESS